MNDPTPVLLSYFRIVLYLVLAYQCFAVATLYGRTTSETRARNWFFYLVAARALVRLLLNLFFAVGNPGPGIVLNNTLGTAITGGMIVALFFYLDFLSRQQPPRLKVSPTSQRSPLDLDSERITPHVSRTIR